MTDTALRALDAGGPFPIFPPSLEREARDGDHAIVVQPHYVSSAGEVAEEMTVTLRAAELGGGGQKLLLGQRRYEVKVALGSGECFGLDDEAKRLLASYPWIVTALAGELDQLRRRAARVAQQSDRSVPVPVVRAAQRTGEMVSYDELFPADWDLLVKRNGQEHWANDHYCVQLGCTCGAVVVAFQQICGGEAEFVGDVRLDMSRPDAAPEASNSRARELYAALSAENKALLRQRYEEVRRGVERVAAAVVSTTAPARVGRNDPCPCGSGKKYKRCCAGRDAAGPGG